MKNKNNNILKRYKDPLGLSSKKMNFGLWYVSHRKHFRNAFIIILILISITTWFRTIYVFTDYIAKGIKKDEQLISQITQSLGISHEYIVQSSPESLKIGQIKIIKPLDNYDIFLKVENFNQDYLAYFDYSFILNGKESESFSNFILPGETKYISLLSHESISRINRASFNIKNITWDRIDKHKIPDWDAFKDQRLAIESSDIKFLPAKKSGLSEKLNFNLLEFIITNNTPYNYWNVDFHILLYARGNIVGITKYSIKELYSGKSKKVQLTIPGQLSSVTGTEIIPELDITRNDIYIKYE